MRTALRQWGFNTKRRGESLDEVAGILSWLSRKRKSESFPSSRARGLWSDRVVWGGVEPPTFRFSGGFADPGASAVVPMSWWSPVSAVLSCQRRLYPSSDVVSTALAGSPKASHRSLKTEQ
jgi:hypothetical protein